MKRKNQKSDAFYKNAVKGLRHYCKGFDAADGYDLRDFDDWSPQRKAQVTKYAMELSELTARPNHVFRGHNKEHMRKAQAYGQHEPGFPKIKVAFIPYTAPADMPKAPPILNFKNESLKVDSPDGRFSKIFVDFKKKKIISNADLEVARAFSIAQAQGASLYQIQAGKFLVGAQHGGTATSLKQAQDKVKALMAKYSGKGAMPANSKNKNDKAEDHDCRNWLVGITAYILPGGKNTQEHSRVLKEWEMKKNFEALKRKATKRKLGVTFTGKG